MAVKSAQSDGDRCLSLLPQRMGIDRLHLEVEYSQDAIDVIQRPDQSPQKGQTSFLPP